ncbi:MAG: MFS transporter [Bacteroidales bacterium]|nr:MFS transporter [Bacteroidales bacterium]
MSRTTIKPHQGIPTSLMWMLAVMAGVSVANLYYCQPLLNMIREDLHLTEFEVNLMPVFTQVGYALGLLFIIPMGDKYNRRKTMMTCAMVLTCSLLSISIASHVWVLLTASFVTGFFSVIPQMFMPFASLYSRPNEKERRVGMILSGLLIGILGSRVASGYIGHVMGWRSMYIIAAIMLMAMTCMVYACFPDVAPTYKGKFRRLLFSIRTLAIEHPRSLLYSIRSGFAFGSFLGLWGCLAFRMKEAPFFVGSDVVGLLGICGMAGAMTASNVGKYIPRYGVNRIHSLGITLQLLAWIMLGVLHQSYTGIILSIIIIDIGMQCIQLSNQSATMKLCPEASSRMNTIYMVTYFIGGSLGTFLAGTFWSLYGWTGTVSAGILMLVCSIISTIVIERLIKNKCDVEHK